MRPILPLALVCLFLGAGPAVRFAAGQPPAAIAEELQVTEKTLAELQAMKAEIKGIEERLDALIAELSERKGKLQNAKPAPFGGITTPSVAPDRPDPRPVTVRCAAITKEGTRCTRPALAGQRYCKQHGLSKQK